MKKYEPLIIELTGLFLMLVTFTTTWGLMAQALCGQLDLVYDPVFKLPMLCGIYLLVGRYLILDVLQERDGITNRGLALRTSWVIGCMFTSWFFMDPNSGEHIRTPVIIILLILWLQVRYFAYLHDRVDSVDDSIQHHTTNTKG